METYQPNSSPNYQGLLNVCNIWTDNAERHRDNIPFLLSIVVDIVCGISSAGYLRQFYKSIEISHPLYSILFSNIIFSTGVTFVAFGNTVIWYTNVISCVTMFEISDHIQFAFLLMNNFSWITIACIRRTLLAKEESDSIDFPKLRLSSD